MLVIVGGMFGASLRWIDRCVHRTKNQADCLTDWRTLFFGGILFAVTGVCSLTGLARCLPIDLGNAVLALL